MAVVDTSEGRVSTLLAAPTKEVLSTICTSQFFEATTKDLVENIIFGEKKTKQLDCWLNRSCSNDHIGG